MDEKASRVEQLFKALDASEGPAPLELEHEIVGMGTTAVAFLVDTLRADAPRSRYKAAKLLGKIAASTHDPNLVEPLIEALKSPDFMVRQIAAQALGLLDDRRAVDVLIETLKDDKIMVQLWAAESLGKLGADRAIAPLVELLQLTDSSTLRHTIIRALGVLGTPEVIPIILAFEDDEDSHVRSGVAESVQKLRKKDPSVT